MVNWVYTPTIINYHNYRGWLRNPNHQLKTVEKHPIILFGFLPSEIGGAGLQDFASIHSRLESKKPSGKDHQTASILPSGNHVFFFPCISWVWCFRSLFFPNKLNPLKSPLKSSTSHQITIFLCFSYGFPMVFLCFSP